MGRFLNDLRKVLRCPQGRADADRAVIGEHCRTDHGIAKDMSDLSLGL